MKNTKSFPGKLSKAIGSDKFFWAIITVFIAQALWVAFSIQHSSLYDEQMHYGISNSYSDNINPFVETQELSEDVFGDITRHSSYLYYYFMGKIIFIISLFSDSFAIKLISLRIVSLLFVGLGLLVYRKVLLNLGFSKKITHFVLFFFTLLPVSSFTAGQMNYDDPLFLFFALILLYLTRAISAKKFDAMSLSLLFFYGTLATLIKFAFLPVLAGALLAAMLGLVFKHKAGLHLVIKEWWVKSSSASVILVLFLVGTSGFLLAERYGQNYVKYGSLLPTCNKIMSAERCQENFVYSRNKAMREVKPAATTYDPFMHIGEWTATMVNTTFNLRLFELDPQGWPKQELVQPLPVIYRTFQLLVLISIPLTIYYARNILRQPARKYIMIVPVFYVGAILFHSYTDYQEYGIVAAANSRYLLVIMPLIFALSAESIAIFLRKFQYGTTILAVTVVALFTQGGGIISPILQAQPKWYWQNEIILSGNDTAKKILQPIVRENL